MKARPSPPASTSAATASRLLLLAFFVLTALAAVRIATTATFLFDVGDRRFAVHGMRDFGVRHNCFTCLAVGDDLASSGAENLYDESHYGEENGTPTAETIAGKLSIDPLPYPPPSLLIVHFLRKIGADFFEMRAAWYVLSVLAFAAALTSLAFWAGAWRDRSALLLFPVVFLLPATTVSLQIGNIHLLVVSLSLAAMVAFAKRRAVLGGALLGYAITVKLWPAILLAYLLLGRRWKAAASTLAAVTAYCLLTLAVYGPEPFADFFSHQLPRLLNGEAFSFMQRSRLAILANISAYAWPHKLAALGVIDGRPPLLSAPVGWAYTGFLVLALLFAGLGQGRRNRVHEAGVWLGLLTLAQLRSPFLPLTYGITSTLWLLLFLLPGSGRLRAALLVVLLCGLGLDAPMFAVAHPNPWILAFSMLASATAFGASTLGIARARKEPLETGGHPGHLPL